MRAKKQRQRIERKLMPRRRVRACLCVARRMCAAALVCKPHHVWVRQIGQRRRTLRTRMRVPESTREHCSRGRRSRVRSRRTALGGAAPCGGRLLLPSGTARSERS